MFIVISKFNTILQSMSNFKTKAVILKINKLSKNDFIYTILSYDYWRLKVNKKVGLREKNLDLWYIINCEIKTNQKSDIHKIKNIKIISEFYYEDKDFKIINSFLDLIALINNNLPENMVFFEIYNLLETTIRYKKITYNKLLLIKLKVINLIWLLNIESDNNLVKKILSYINKNSIKDIIKLKWIDENTKVKLEHIYNNFKN